MSYHKIGNEKQSSNQNPTEMTDGNLNKNTCYADGNTEDDSTDSAPEDHFYINLNVVLTSGSK
jgi:hypothetical protein